MRGQAAPLLPALLPKLPMLARKTILISVSAIAAVSALTAGAVSMTQRDGGAVTPTNDTATITGIRERHIQVSAGVGLHVAERGDPNGTPVVLLHGLSDSWSSFNRVAEYFPKDMRVIAIDMRGHGESSKPAGDYSVPTLARDVAAVLDSLKLDRVHVVGHSMGSLIAQHLVALRADRVQSLVLIGSTRGGAYIPAGQELQRAFAQFTDDEAPVTDEFARGFQVSTLHVPVPPAFLDSVVDASLKLPVRVWKGLLAGLLADSGPAVRGQVRTMIMWGEQEMYMPRSEQTELVKLYNATFVQVDSTGHAPHWERPEQSARTLVRFIRNEGVEAAK